MSGATVTPIRSDANSTRETTEAVAVARALIANEFVFGVVGPAGSGTSETAKSLLEVLKEKGFDPYLIKARDIIESWAKKEGKFQSHSDKLDHVGHLQDLGDDFRKSNGDYGAVAHGLIGKIRSTRAERQGQSIVGGEPIIPDGTRRAYILDSLRHPAEVRLLRTIYQNAFCLIAVVCDEDVRTARLVEKFADSGRPKIIAFQKRDEHAPKKYGQRVAAAFQLSDFFIDNTPDRFIKKAGAMPVENPNWNVVHQLERLVDVLSYSRIVRPTSAETAMFHAYGARMRSSCLSRQVGAAIIGKNGNLIATGTNDVPKAGGGLYGEDHSSGSDSRCFVQNKYCSNTKEQINIIEELFSEIDELKTIILDKSLIKRIRETRLGQLIEFSRAVHAEMDAIVAAARSGSSPSGGRLFVTTFPCHNCARHIVAAGIDEVQYIEPYLKSKAMQLHSDAIMSDPKKWIAPSVASPGSDSDNSRVLFRPFTGVAPRLYRRAFLKDRDLKQDETGELLAVFGDPDATSLIEPLRLSYAEMEARVTAKT